jgi:hypothetical protein
LAFSTGTVWHFFVKKLTKLFYFKLSGVSQKIHILAALNTLKQEKTVMTKPRLSLKSMKKQSVT